MSTIQRYRVIIEDKGVERQTFIDKDSFVVGRTHTADLVINGDLISRKQVKVHWENEVVWVEDLGSTNGSWIETTRLTPGVKTPLRMGQRLALGSKSGPYLKIEFQEFKDSTVVNIKRDSTQGINIPQMPRMEELSEAIHDEMIVAKVSGGSSIPIGRSNPHTSNPRIQSTRSMSIRRPQAVPTPPPISRGESTSSMAVKFDQVKSDAENKLFDHIRALVGNEAEEIRQASIDEARVIKQEAEAEAVRIIRAAKEKAEKGIDDSESFIKQRMAFLGQHESEVKDKVRQLQGMYNALEKKVEELKAREENHRHNLNHIQSTVKEEESRIQNERSQIEALRTLLADEKRKYEIRLEEVIAEERRIKTKMDNEVQEAKLKASQLQSEAERSMSLRDTLAPEIEALKLERNQQIEALKTERDALQEESRDLEVKLRRHQKDLERTTQDYEYINKELAEAKKEHERITRQSETERHALLKLERELDLREVETQKNLVQSQNLLAETSGRAKAEAQKIIDDAQKLSNSMLEKARSDVEDAQLRRKQIEFDLELERKRLFDALEKETEKLREEKRLEIEDLTKKRDHLIADVSTRNKINQEEFNKIVEEAHVEGQELRRRAEAEILQWKEEAKKESDSIKDQALRYAEESKLKSDNMLEQLKQEVANKKKESMVQMAQLEEKKKQMEKEWQEQRKKQEAILADGNVRVQEILDEAHGRGKEILEQVEREALEARRRNEVEAQKELEKARLAGVEAMKKVDAETKEYKAKQQASLAELKHVEMMNIKEMRTKAEAEIQERKAEKAKAVATNVYALVASEMYKARNKVMDEEFIKPFTEEIKGLIVDTLLDRVSADGNRLQEILKTSTNTKAKEQRFWKKTAIIGGSVAFVLLVLWIFPGIITTPSSAFKNAVQDQSSSKGSEEFLAQVQEARARKIFNPPTTPEIKSSYADNVLYTTDYADKRQAKAFQDKWILELNEYFISTLDVKDTTIIKFVSLENTLLRDLIKLKSEATQDDYQSKIDAMHAREAEFKNRLSELFEDPNKVARYYNYSKSFWIKFYESKKP